MQECISHNMKTESFWDSVFFGSAFCITRCVLRPVFPLTAAFGFLHAWSSSHLVPFAAALSSTCVLSLPHRFMDGALHVSQPLLLCVSSHLRFHFLHPGHRGLSVKSLIWCARYTVCSFVFLFPPFPASVSVLRVCLPLTASPAAFFRNGPNQVPIISSELHAPQSSGPDQYPESFLPGVPTPNCSACPRTFSFPSIQEVLHLPQAFPAKSVG